MPAITVLPWNGAEAAVSLTFDDGDPSAWETAVPALNQRHLKGTFFLIAGSITDKSVWIQAHKDGQEIGNHTMTHSHPDTLTPEQIVTETEGAQKKLSADCGADVVSFAYPYTEVTPALTAGVKRTHIAARGGYTGPATYLRPTDDPDWYNIPSRVTLTELPLETYTGWIDEGLAAHAWTVLQIHAIEGAPWGYSPVPKKVFFALLDRLVDTRIWVAPFGTVAAYWQAQKIVEKAAPSKSSGVAAYAWSVPKGFPPGVTLRIRLDDPADRQYRLTQAGKHIPREPDGAYVVSFDAGGLTIAR